MLKARQDFRALLDTLPFDTPITDKRVFDVLRCHNHWPNIDEYTVVKERQFTNHSNLVAIKEDFRALIGWNAALRHKYGLSSPPRKQMVEDAARWEIYNQIMAFRQGRYGEVDHVTQFIDLWRAFLTEEGLQSADVEVIKPDYGRIETQFKDRALASRWQAYHKKHARLQLLSPEEHKEVTRQRIERQKKNLGL